MEQKYFFQKKIILGFCFLLIAFTGALFSTYFDTKILSFKKEPVLMLSIDPLTIIAQSVFVLDTSSGDVIFSKNSDDVLPIASITKIMTAITALDKLKREELIVPYLYQNTEEDFLEKSIFLDGDPWKLSSLIKYMLIISSNETAEVIKEYSHRKGIDLVSEMNQNAKFFGLWKTHFLNTSGLDINGQEGGAVSSAEDIAFLFKNAIQRYPDIFETTRHTGYNISSEKGTVYFAQNTNKITGELPGLYASKTGYTELANGNLVFATKTKSDKLIIVSILNSTYDGRFEDAKKINNEIQKIK